MLVETRGPLGLITLNRPKALNALSGSMIEIIEPALAVWAKDDRIAAVLIRGAGGKAFCAGGDVRAIATGGDSPEARRMKAAYFAAEYRLNYHIHTFAKPFIALIDGITMGGGCGLVAPRQPCRRDRADPAGHGRRRCWGCSRMSAPPGSSTALPARWASISACPACGCGASDLVALGMAQVMVPSDRAEALIADLAAGPLDTAAIDAALARHAGDAGASQVAARQSAVEPAFRRRHGRGDRRDAGRRRGGVGKRDTGDDQARFADQSEDHAAPAARRKAHRSGRDVPDRIPPGRALHDRP